jgi:hypothetical protein
MSPIGNFLPLGGHKPLSLNPIMKKAVQNFYPFHIDE